MRIASRARFTRRRHLAMTERQEYTGGSSMTVRLRLACRVAFIALIVAATHARAASLAYEGFNVNPVGPPLLGANSGSGFASPWVPGGFNASIFTNDTVASGSLPYPNLQTSGNHV